MQTISMIPALALLLLKPTAPVKVRPAVFSESSSHRRIPRSKVVSLRQADGERYDPKEQLPWGWAMTHSHKDNRWHSWPTWDHREHRLDPHCECGMILDAAGSVHHQSFDGRENYENGEALRH